MSALYNFFGDYLRNKYKFRIFKLPINANLSCPNRDGAIDDAGCIFCSEDGSASPTSTAHKDIIEQMENAKKNFKRSSIETKYIAYFQAYSNTYTTVDILKELYDSSIVSGDIVGLMIGTRPDCLPDDIINLIAQYKKENFELWLEIGMQSMHDKSLKYLNRKHIHEKTRESIIKAAQKGIPVCVHLIIGIPGESWEDIMGTADEVASLPVDGVKFHHLHVIEGTELHNRYKHGIVNLLTLNEYKSIICDFIERLDRKILIHRLMGDRNENSLVAPKWGLHKGTVIKAIEDEFVRRGTCQGFLFNKKNSF